VAGALGRAQGGGAAAHGHHLGHLSIAAGRAADLAGHGGQKEGERTDSDMSVGDACTRASERLRRLC